MDYDSIAKAGSMLGSGAVIVMDDTAAWSESLKRLSYFYMHESCGQCTPAAKARAGSGVVVDRIQHGRGRPSDMDLLNSVADNIQGAPSVRSATRPPCRCAMIKALRHEFRALIEARPNSRPSAGLSRGSHPHG